MLTGDIALGQTAMRKANIKKVSPTIFPMSLNQIGFSTFNG